jgi:hypothetical protein
MDPKEQHRVIRQAEMIVDYQPLESGLMPVTAEMRLAHAAEYAAYQLGQINKKLDELIERISSKT